MADRKFDPKEWAIEAFYTVKELVAQFVEDFRSRDRYFKYKVGIIAAWLAVSTGTFAISCGGGPRETRLHAHAQVTQVADDTTLLVRNDSGDAWREVRLTLNGKFTAYTPEIKPGDKFVLAVKQFVGPEGKVPARDMKPLTLRVTCTDGTDTIDFSQPQAEE